MPLGLLGGGLLAHVGQRVLGQVDDVDVEVRALSGGPDEPVGDGGREAALPGAGDDDGEAERGLGHGCLQGCAAVLSPPVRTARQVKYNVYGKKYNGDCNFSRALKETP